MSGHVDLHSTIQLQELVCPLLFFRTAALFPHTHPDMEVGSYYIQINNHYLQNGLLRLPIPSVVIVRVLG